MLVALFTLGVGVMGLISPETGTTIRGCTSQRRRDSIRPVRFALSMGLVVLLSAATSRAPKTLRLLGAVMCLQGLSSTLMGPEHARAIMEWETMRGTSVLRVGAAVALASGVFMVFALTGYRSHSD